MDAPAADAETLAGLPVARGVDALRAVVGDWRAAGQSVALVPTMGALHAGHLALVERALALAERVVVSLFVNPAQFAPGEDFERYPRDEAADAARLAALGVDLMFAPTIEEMYGDGFATTVSVKDITEGLCGAARPGHFDGVATVVTKLLLQCRPDFAVFGEKDYQQLLTIRRLVKDLDVPVAVESVPTVREADGLALSSRNAYLTDEQRPVAARLNRVLADMAARLERGAAPSDVAADASAALIAAGIDRVEYLEVRDAATLAPIETLSRPARVLAAVRIGKVRLIDNMPVGVVVAHGKRT